MTGSSFPKFMVGGTDIKLDNGMFTKLSKCTGGLSLNNTGWLQDAVFSTEL